VVATEGELGADARTGLSATSDRIHITNSTTAHAAILATHGIGEQNPYETLDSFAGCLANHFAHSKAALRAERISHHDCNRSRGSATVALRPYDHMVDSGRSPR
jgi:hypothetical protein